MRIGAVILAAGASTRFGGIKQLLPLGGISILQHVINIVEQVGFQKVVIVLGANQEVINPVLKLGAETEVIINRDWKMGQSSSVRLGVEKLKDECDALIFFLGDQPFVTRALIDFQIGVFAEKKPEIIAPRFAGKRGNPVLFSASCFKELQSLKGEGGGKALFNSHPVTEFDWPTDLENFDIDTEQDYERAVGIYNAHSQFCTIILSAGLSTRMKQAKLLMPWGNTSVLGTVINAFRNAGVVDIRVITGGYREEVEREAGLNHATCIFNPNFANGEMLDSVRTGINSILESSYKAAFIALGDQPAVSCEDIYQMMQIFNETRAPLIIPSYEMRRGHPWLVAKKLWPSILNLKPPKTMRDFIEENKDQITYYVVKNSRILEDLDTPEDYEKYHPR